MLKFRVELDSNTKNCFVGLPKSVIKDKFITQATLKLTWSDTKTSEYRCTYLGWSWDTHNKKETIIIPNLLAKNLNLNEGDQVNIQILHDKKFSKKIFVQPKTFEDSEILEQNQINIEETLRNQIFILYEGLVFPFYLNNGISISIEVLDIEFEQEHGEKFVILDGNTELIVKTKPNPFESSELKKQVELKVFPFEQEDEMEKKLQNHVYMKKDNILNLKTGEMIKLKEFVFRVEILTQTNLKKNEVQLNKNIMKLLEIQSFENIKSSLFNDNLSPIIQLNAHLIDFKNLNLYELKQHLKKWLKSQKFDKIPLSSKNYISIESEDTKEIKNLILTVPGSFVSFYELNEQVIDRLFISNDEKLISYYKEKEKEDGLLFEYVPIFENLSSKAQQILKPLNLFNKSFFQNNNLLVSGPSGSGKTIFSKIVCLKLKLPLEIVSCKALTGDRTDNNFNILKKKISNAVEKSPSIILIDDLEILFPKEQEEMPDLNIRVLSSLFVDLLNSIHENQVQIIATCQQFDEIHEIIQNSNLFEEKLFLPLPDKSERKKLLEFNSFLKINENLLEKIAIETDNYTPFDIKNLMNKMTNNALIHSSDEITLDNFLKISKDFSIQSTIGTKLLKSDTAWEDIGGLKEVKSTLVETFQIPIKYSKLFKNTPLKLRSGLLIYGFPGCGKTFLASAVSKECGLNFLTVKGPEVLNKYIGASEQAIRSIFEKAEAAKPCIIFFDEFDSIAAERGKDNTGVTDRVVNQLLVQLDGVESREGVYILAATSRPDLIDPALLRPGRLDKSLFCGLPDEQERFDILSKLSKTTKFDDDIDLKNIAELCENYTGADLNALLYTAHLESTHDMIKNFKDEIGNQPEESVKVTTFGQERNINIENLIENLRLKNEEKDQVEVKVSMKHFQIALNKTKPSLSNDEIQKFEYFYENFTSGKKSQEKHVTLM
eukprot:gene630-8134_t